MWTRGVLILGLIICWTAKCNSEDGIWYDYGIGDIPSNELAEDYLFRSEDDKCEPNPCKNSGTCEKDEEDFKCTCTGNWIGKTCEENKCEPNPCKNSGTCEKDGEDFKCTCTGNWIGKTCEENKCEPNPCKNSGTCQKDGKDFKCTCTENWIGKTCEEECDCGENGNCSITNGKKKCECKEKFAQKDGKCEECNCGDKGNCFFENGVKKCGCFKGHIEDEGICKECDCGENGKCYFENGEKHCNCSPTFVFKEKDGKCHKCDCGTGGKCDFNEDTVECTCNEGFEEYNKTCKECDCGQNGDCTFEENGKKKCNCFDDYAVKKEGNKVVCTEICENTDECRNEGECKIGEEEGQKVCFCKSGFEGDKCEEITECVTGKYSKCKESGGECKLNGTRITCECKPETQTLDESLEKPICKAKCSKDSDCQHGGTCNTTTNLCKCKRNTSGDKCQDIVGCDTLNCKSIDAKCIYDIKNEMATCKCDDNNYYYENRKCTPEWCKTGCNTAVSTCKYEKGVGICNCKTEKKYYDYGAKTCKEIDPCFNITCVGDLICKNGTCDCPENHRRNGTTCEPPDLCKDKCFTGAQCEQSSNSGYVRCLCNSPSKFYSPKQKKCNDGVCFLPVERKNCSGSCPTGMNREEGECKHKDGNKTCGEDCGFLGWCEKTNDAHKCRCDPDYAEEDKKTKKCVLKTSVVCPENERDGDSKCKCTGKYKQATNGITCDLKSCSDEDIQKECKLKRATKCVDYWKNDIGYKCVCPEGYIDDEDKGCIDPCSQDKAKDECSAKGQMCFIGQKINDIDCRCPPTFTYDGNKKSCDLDGANTFVIHRLPVLSKKYETVENSINKVLLNIDVSTSMMQAFRNLDFAHVLDFKVDKPVLFCDVWLQFQIKLPEKFNASAEVQRWTHQLRKINDQSILLPGLFLSSDHLDAAKEEELTLCTPSVQQSLCGTGSTCVNDTCFCDTGFKEIDSTIKASGNKRIVRCEDIDECKEGKHNCADNSECVNTVGDYFCKCKPGFKKEKDISNGLDKEACIGLCDAKPCGKGTCQLTKENTVDCTCPAGYTGSFCNRSDVNLAKASKATKVVGAVLGTLLAIVIILIIVYVVRQRKNSYSEDFTPAPRVDNAEMVERRPMRGVTNRAYQ